MTTGSITKKVTSGQEKQWGRFVEDTICEARKQVAIDKGAMQSLLGNGDKVRAGIIDLLIKHSASDDRFGLVTAFKLTVPKGYSHDTQLAIFASFAKNKSEKFYYYNDNITDENFAKVTQKLVPGKTYGVKIFQIKSYVTSEDCLAFLASQRAILVGAQGLSLVRQLKKDQFPTIGKWTVSFDEKDALWADGDG
ncbi:MAG: hypothetical protein AAB906_03590, partial [Patescibacteria group bacterium]